MNEIKYVSSLPGFLPEENVLFANPCKEQSHIDFASSVGVRHMTFDNEDELIKMSKNKKTPVKAILRIQPDDSSSICQLSNKYGADMDSVRPLLEASIKYGVEVVGVSFHCGSGCQDEYAYVDACELARKAFDIGEELGLSSMKLLDIGGGFPGTLEKESQGDSITFEGVAGKLNVAFDRLFPSSDIRIVGEPGRFFVHACMHVYANIISRRVEPSGCMYYVNDGVYGSFNSILYDHAVVMAEMPEEAHRNDPNTEESSVWGPTCDGLDCIVPKVQLPRLQVGDWLYFRNMGAYTIAASSNFNGMKSVDRVYV